MVNVFKELKNKTVIIVSHQKKLIDNADYILLLNSVQDAQIGKKNEMLPLLNSPQCRKLGGLIND